MDWSQRRKIFYAALFAGIIILLAAYPVYNLVKQTPTCSDQRKNGAETGVDCGGGCALFCPSEVKAPRIVWAKAFPLEGNKYDIGAYVENPNTNAGIKSAQYTIRVFSSAGQVLADIKGSTELAPASAILLFETGLTFATIASRVEVIFNPVDLNNWTKASISSSVVLTKNQSLINTDTKPRFDAILVNTDPLDDVANLQVGAVIYDVLRNPIAISHTFVDSIPKNSEKNIFFTWPSHFTKYARGEKCLTTLDTTTATSSGSIMSLEIACPHENFITEIIITPRAIFAQ